MQYSLAHDVPVALCKGVTGMRVETTLASIGASSTGEPDQLGQVGPLEQSPRLITVSSALSED